MFLLLLLCITVPLKFQDMTGAVFFLKGKSRLSLLCLVAHFALAFDYLLVMPAEAPGELPCLEPGLLWPALTSRGRWKR